MVQELGAITVRGNHDEVALERYQTWKLTGTLDVSLPSANGFTLLKYIICASPSSFAGGKRWQ